MPVNHVDPRKPERTFRYKPILNGRISPGTDDFTSEYANIFAMLFSMCGLMLRMKWGAWLALFCSCVGFANYKSADDRKQVMSSFMLSISALTMCYIQDPRPMALPIFK